MRKALSDTSLIWIVVAMSLLVQALLAAGISVPLIERTGVWRMATQPWTIAALAAVGAATVLAVVHGPGPAPRRARVIGWTLGLLSAACLFAFDPATAVVILMTARLVHGGPGPRALYRSLARGGPGPERVRGR